MIARSVRARSGITLTEILISILIMGIGLISLATLFPLGLIRLRDAARFQRGSLLVQSASDDVDARSLLLKPSFTQTWYGVRDPFTADVAGSGVTIPVVTTVPGGVDSFGNQVLAQPGLPVCYDPLWRALTNVVPGAALADPTLNFTLAAPFQAAEARFGAGIVNGVNAFGLRLNAPLDTTIGSGPSAYGLQRITNFIPWSPTKFTALYPFTYHNPGGIDVAGDVFTSIDDIVFNSTEGATKGSSPLLPDLTLNPGGSLTNPGPPVGDWRYTWFFTGRQVDSTNGTMFQGDMVVCDGRQFAFAPLPAPNATTSVPIGETVVEAIFGYSTQVGATGFSVGADRTVLLRWPTTIADPSIRIGGWIADVTYERDEGVTRGNGTPQNPLGRVGATHTPFQRCNWYQVVKRTDAQPDPDLGPTFRRMILTIASPVKTKTLLAAGGLPQFLNVALVMPSVINVYPRSFTIH